MTILGPRTGLATVRGAFPTLARAALGAQPGDDLDDEIDLVGQQRVEVDEAIVRDLWKFDVSG